MVELQGKGSATNGATPSSLFIPHTSGIIFQEVLVFLLHRPLGWLQCVSVSLSIWATQLPEDNISSLGIFCNALVE